MLNDYANLTKEIWMLKVRYTLASDMDDFKTMAELEQLIKEKMNQYKELLKVDYSEN